MDINKLIIITRTGLFTEEDFKSRLVHAIETLSISTSITIENNNIFIQIKKGVLKKENICPKDSLTFYNLFNGIIYDIISQDTSRLYNDIKAISDENYLNIDINSAIKMILLNVNLLYKIMIAGNNTICIQL